MNSLGIEHREVNLKKDILFFCKTPSGQTFNVQLKNNQMVKIWSFVSSTAVEKAGSRYEFITCADGHTKAGIEVTTEGDLSYYMTQTINFDQKRSVESLYRNIDSYLQMLFYIKLKNKPM